MTDPIQEFIVESLENLDKFDAHLLVLEENPSEKKTIAAIFRTLHTIKGTCGFLGLSKLESLAHAGENLLALVRDEAIPFSPSIATALLATGDAIRNILAEVEKSKTEGESDHGSLIEKLVSLQVGGPVKKQSPESLNPKASPKKETAFPFPAAPPFSSPAIPSPLATTAHPTGTGEADEKSASSGIKASEASIRVQLETLDALMNLVGELVLTRNRINQLASDNPDSEMQSTVHRLSQITSDLQDGMMKTRVQPIDILWSKFPRTIRDLAELTQKKIRLVTEGAETELDRTVMDAIKEPLVHLLRNSVDHGIETPEKRLAAGKSEEGTILLRAFHAAGLVTLEIADDGAGIQPERLKAKAIEKKLISRETADRMSPRELMQLIFLPGFSTAESVSTISGRGVGMDVVKTQIEKIGGLVELQSERGKGTTFRIKIPLTLAILPAVIVRCCDGRYAIPQANLVEVLALEEPLRVESIQNALVVRLRGSFLPVVRLRSVLELQRKKPFPKRHLAVLRIGSRQFGLVVDSIEAAQEIVVKPLHRSLMSLSCFAGSTILGDGEVALILDIFGISTRSQVLPEEELTQEPSREPLPAQDSAGEEPVDQSLSRLLIVRVGGTRAAIPLQWVHRLEEFPAENVEQCAGRRVVQYEGEILPLLPVAKAINLPETSADPAVVQTVIYRHADHSIGLIVESVEIITRDRVELKSAGKRPGVLGSAVIQNRVTEFLDIPSILDSHAPEFLTACS